ncbi:MAG: hypothetical protein AUH86_25075 [Acidobacteria bacterium 13_1_40CM_4_58_4]|nr:MAG: hypothetical protein AUH86_25075 [Acidobacteria bacterium 13_1_40CM_4_58_4]
MPIMRPSARISRIKANLEASLVRPSLHPSFPASSSFASTISPISKRNSTTLFAPLFSKPFREKAAFIPPAKLSGIALALSRPSVEHF